MRWVVLAVIFCSAFAVQGCGTVQVTDKTAPTPAAPPRPTSVAEAPNTQETHDIAIAAIDFDPALGSADFLPGKPYSLLVAVENKGNRQESNFTVSAQLLTQDKQVVMQQQKTISKLAAGDVTVVRFPSATTPPPQRVYLLNVTIQNVPQESNTGNNKRTLEIEIRY